MSIDVRDVSKSFGDFVALDDVSVSIPTGQLTALLGPSGGGKSTLLRIIAGLESADTGSIKIEGAEATHLPAQKRNVGFVFQHYAAFKHMSVAKNVAFGLEIRKRPKAEVRDRVDELLRLVHLQQFAHRLPSQLSGGQRQRMALARALAVEPKVLLLDEPFGALDAKVRKELRDWLRRLHDEVHVTTVFVTHDQEEALEVADEIVVINDGRIEQIGTPDELYDAPANDFVMSFLGPGHPPQRPAHQAARHRAPGDRRPARGHPGRRHAARTGRVRGAPDRQDRGRPRPAGGPHPCGGSRRVGRRRQRGLVRARPRGADRPGDVPSGGGLRTGRARRSRTPVLRRRQDRRSVFPAQARRTSSVRTAGFPSQPLPAPPARGELRCLAAQVRDGGDLPLDPPARRSHRVDVRIRPPSSVDTAPSTVRSRPRPRRWGRIAPRSSRVSTRGFHPLVGTGDGPVQLTTRSNVDTSTSSTFATRRVPDCCSRSM